MNMQQLTANIPLELKAKPNWVGHRGKIPMNPFLKYQPAASNDNTTWANYTTTIQSYPNSHWDGIGFMFEPPYIGIDLDDSVIDGKLTDFAQKIMDQTNSYTEYSPSGTGIHIIIKGELPAPIKTSTLEVYQTGRYFTMTGNRISNHSLIREIKDLSFLYPRGSNIVRTTLAEKIQAVQEGNRNNSLTSLAGFYRRKGLEPQEIFDTLLPKAKEVNFDEKELWTICRSVGRYQPAVISTEDDSIDALLKDRTEREWYIDDVIATNSLNFLAGTPKSRKSWLLIDLAIEAAKRSTGGLWLGRFPVKKPLKVLYIDQERSREEGQRRFAALMEAKGLTGKDLDLRAKYKTTIRIDLDHSFEAFKKDLRDKPVDLILVDSFVRFHTKNVMDQASIQPVLERIKEIIDEFGCSFVFIYHDRKPSEETKDKTPTSQDMIGSQFISAAADNCFSVRKQDRETSMVYHTDNNLGDTFPPFLVKVEDLEVDKSKIRVYTL